MSLIMVTGSSGFVGSNLIKTLRSKAINVRAISREERPNAQCIRSYGPETDWSQPLKGVDCIVHLAARVHVMRETTSDPMDAFREANCHSTLNLARQAALSGTRRFIFMSTIKVNGERTEEGLPFTSASPTNPQDAYAISKFEAERELLLLSRSTGMEVTVVRPPLIYGAGVKGNFRPFMHWATMGLPSIFQRVHNRRSMIFVENLNDLIRILIDHPKAGNRVFLASDAECFSTHELLTHLAAANGKIPISIPVSPDLIKWVGNTLVKKNAVRRLTENLEIDARETSEVLSWKPPFSCQAGLERTVKGLT